MTRYFQKLFVAGFCLFTGWAAIVSAERLGPYQCLKTDIPIKIDGKLDEPVWEKCEAIHFKDIATGALPPFDSEAKLAWDEKYLYAAMIFKDPNVWAAVDLSSKIKYCGMCPSRGKYEIMLWDCFAKFFFDPDADGENYLEFHVNPFNSLYDAYIRVIKDFDSLDIPRHHTHWEWNCVSTLHAVCIDGTLNDFSDTDKGWSAELAIPWDDIQTFIKGNCPPKNGNIWKAHVGRVYRKGPAGDRQYWTWPVMGIVNCHIPDKWETIQFVGPKAPQAAEKIWRGGWAQKEKDAQLLVDTAKKLGFSALMIRANDDFNYLNDLCARARQAEIDIYYWTHIMGNENNKDWWQVVTPEEAEKADRIKDDKEPGKHGYQGGGEPVNDQTDVHIAEFLCFHRPEVMEDCKRKLENVIRECPDLAGIAFDGFGYKNYRCCHCPVSEKMFEDYYKKFLEGKMPRDKALERFSLDTLVDFNNRLAEYCRQIKPGTKVVNHVWPTFIADPLYGNRLNLDYCMQTVAWYFEPFWNSDKIEKYTVIVTQDAKRYFARPQGIPFVGIYLDDKDPKRNKPAERFRKELRAIRKCGTQSFSICPFNIFIAHPELGDILIEELELPSAFATR